jgi:hypothetical protein
VGDVVYLTADSPNTLSELDTSKVYVIGGIVDRNRHKGICYERAQAAGVATAKLPIGDLFKLATSNVSSAGPQQLLLLHPGKFLVVQPLLSHHASNCGLGAV